MFHKKMVSLLVASLLATVSFASLASDDVPQTDSAVPQSLLDLPDSGKSLIACSAFGQASAEVYEKNLLSAYQVKKPTDGSISAEDAAELEAVRLPALQAWFNHEFFKRRYIMMLNESFPSDGYDFLYKGDKWLFLSNSKESADEKLALEVSCSGLFDRVMLDGYKYDQERIQAMYKEVGAGAVSKLDAFLKSYGFDRVQVPSK